MLPWKSIITLRPDVKRPLYLQISDALIKEISARRIQPAQNIPGSRKMAELIGVNRKTVIQAYDELLAQGWIQSKRSSGTYISDDLPINEYDALNASELLVKKLKSPEVNPFDYIPTSSSNRKKVITVDGGSPDHRLAPMDWIYRESRSIINTHYGKKLLTYSDIHGDIKLRNTLALYLSETRGMNLSTENLLITRGSQMGIFLATQALTNPDDKVVIGSSSYDAADWAFNYHGCDLQRVPVDQDGLNIDALAELCSSQNIKMVYITPHHHFPTTVTLSNARRIQLLELSIRHNFIILEDDYDYDFHYKSSSILPLASLSHGGRVIYVGSFSKVFAPNVRVGYVAASGWQVDRMARIRRIIDRQGDQIMERVMAQAILAGELSRHLKKSLRVYKQRRNHLSTLLKAHLGDQVEFNLPEGGMAIWLKFNNLKLEKLKHTFLDSGLFLDIDKYLAMQFNAFRFGFASLHESEQIDVVKKMVEVIKPRASSTSS
ncbi:MAG: PLP-dependent aminotransferase family protein [Bacteroidota bacterium]